MSPGPIVGTGLRTWQQAAHDHYFATDRQDYLLQATPGGGKTKLGLYIARRLLNEGKIGRIVMIAPSIVIKRQWQEDAFTHFGMSLCDREDYESGVAGLVTTYQEVAGVPEKFSRYCEQDAALAILDEVHHAGEKKSWGNTLEQAVQTARRLALTGTPFRTDNHKIAFVNYMDGTCTPDYVYTYREAVRDGYCRNMNFPRFGGMASWQREGEAAKEVAISSRIPRKERAAMVQAVLDPNGGFVKSMLGHANERLSEMPGAGGLVLADSIEHARGLAKTLEDLTGVKPVMATSDLKGAAWKNICNFRESDDRWIVTVRMVSEGVDIPRLRVVCYLTKYCTDLFFQQAVGRASRGTGEAYFYVPDIPEIKLLAATCFDVEPHELKPDEIVAGGGRREYSPPTAVEILGSTGFLVSETPFVQKMDSEELIEDAQLASKHRKAYLKARWDADPELRKRVNERSDACRKVRLADPEYRKLANEQKRDWWAADPEFRRRKREYEKIRRADPEYRRRKNEQKRAQRAAKKQTVPDSLMGTETKSSSRFPQRPD